MRGCRVSYRSSALSKSDANRMLAPELRTLFPKLMQLRVQLTFLFDAKRPPADLTHILHPPALAYFRYPCPINGCSGEFRLDLPAMRLLRESRSATADEIGCSGVRSEDRLTGTPCATRLKFRIDASYSALY